MAIKNPYIKSINPNTTDSHQTSCGYLLTFVRWSNRSTYNYTTPKEETRKPLTVMNDAVSINISNSKSSITPSLSAKLLAGDINYATAIHPGDFVFVNMVNWDDKVAKIDDYGNDINKNSLRNRASNGKPINGIYDGFKGMFKVQTIKKSLQTDPSSGRKVYYFELQAFGFTEFNTVMYYDPQIYSQLEGNIKFFQQQLEGFWNDVKSKKDTLSIQATLPILISTLLGQGRRKKNLKLPNDTITHFEVPSHVGGLLGIKANYAADIYNYILGVWGSGSTQGETESERLSKGFNPNITKAKGDLPSNFYKTKTTLQGSKLIDAEYWNNIKIWDILKKYLNNVINEMYTTFRVSPEGRIMPTVVIRQKPFTSQHFKSSTKIKKIVAPIAVTEGKAKLSRHLEMPRWKISPNLVYNMSLGMDEAARINFVQVYTRTVSANDSRNRAIQAGTKNYMVDIEDIQRSGLKPYLATANFDYPVNSGSKATKGREWAELVSDWVFDGHLKESGTLGCQGIEEPISVGDNLEFDSIVYHIESISHNMMIDPTNGRKSFKTNLTLSYGVHKQSDETRPVYAEMENTDSHTNRERDFDSERILPGFSDTQNIAGRTEGEELEKTREESYTLKPKINKPKPTTKVDGETDKSDVTDDSSKIENYVIKRD